MLLYFTWTLYAVLVFYHAYLSNDEGALQMAIYRITWFALYSGLSITILHYGHSIRQEAHRLSYSIHEIINRCDNEIVISQVKLI